MESNKDLSIQEISNIFSDDFELNKVITKYYENLLNLETLPHFSIRKNMPSVKSSCRNWRPLFKELCRVKHITSNKDCFCLACGITVEPELSHIIPRIYGGVSSVSNVVPLCSICHKHFDKHFDLSPYNRTELQDFFYWLINRNLSDIVTHLLKKHFYFMSSVKSSEVCNDLTPKNFINKYDSEIKSYKKDCYPLYHDDYPGDDT